MKCYSFMFTIRQNTNLLNTNDSSTLRDGIYSNFAYFGCLRFCGLQIYYIIWLSYLLALPTIDKDIIMHILSMLITWEITLIDIHVLSILNKNYLRKYIA